MVRGRLCLRCCRRYLLLCFLLWCWVLQRCRKRIVYLLCLRIFSRVYLRLPPLLSVRRSRLRFGVCFPVLLYRFLFVCRVCWLLHRILCGDFCLSSRGCFCPNSLLCLLLHRMYSNIRIVTRILLIINYTILINSMDSPMDGIHSRKNHKLPTILEVNSIKQD